MYCFNIVHNTLKIKETVQFWLHTYIMWINCVTPSPTYEKATNNALSDDFSKDKVWKEKLLHDSASDVRSFVLMLILPPKLSNSGNTGHWALDFKTSLDAISHDSCLAHRLSDQMIQTGAQNCGFDSRQGSL